ncbi:U-box domain-containing protein 19-like [Durio zibethinus]|uniref:RING-type E3 ubiquitin transferase n=1 Tax=Durio zibethinus TaxID=66656 RepID=A0A6P5YDP0_DURZI|nr:U-box domain-containing protein 19-like [Durio zibethinus]
MHIKKHTPLILSSVFSIPPMIKNYNCVERRILSFPAVHPCEAVSPATLLGSLITLSQNINNYQSKFLATQRRNARETIRQIGILLVFFEEIRDRGLIVPDSVVLCLSELHLTFQKIRFLLEDCSREGARVWILMKSELVASQFRVLIRTVATALDVLPLNLIDVCGEVKELVELVAKQARKTKIDIDPDDERAMRRVLSVLNRFEKGIQPEFHILKSVLDYLEIKRWSDCNKEIKFLEEEISSQCVDGEERELPFLSSLLGLMSYCRGVIFDTLDNQNSDQSNVRCNVEILSCLNPEDFRCPISLELMIDPVTVSTGQTYDRSSIQKWFKAGNAICPKTGEKLKNTELVPNTNLRKLIHQFCADNGVSLAKTGKQSRDITRTIIPGSPAAAEAMKFLSKFLARKLIFGPSEQKNKAAYEIRLLAKANISNRSCLIEAGTIPPLLNLLFSFDKSMQENAIAALLKISKHASGKKVIVESGGLRLILAVLKRGISLEARQIAAATIFYLSSVKGYRKLIGEMPEAIPALVDLIKEGTACGKKNALVALFGLLLYPGNYQRVLDAGCVPLLLDILLASSDKHELVTDSLAVLATLAESYDGTLAILQTSSLPIITRILQSSTSQAGKENCVSILLSLCSNGGDEAIAVLAKDASIMSSLYSLITDGTTYASKKSRSLLKILHKFHETSSSGQGCQAFTHEQSVHTW